jgi:hypothetical protein
MANRIPTALVSATNRIVDIVARAFQRHYDDDESPADIWIVFIEVPAEGTGPCPCIHCTKIRLATILMMMPAGFYPAAMYAGVV